MWQTGYLLGVLLVVCCVVAEMGVYVDIEEGRVLGKTIEFTEEEFANVSAKINTFKGIPYAEKPMRFSKPMPKQNWTEVFDATEFGHSCPQLIIPEFQGAVPYETDEDCLALNVYAPNQTEQKLPVMVFIHGGGYTTGSSMTPSFSGDEAASGNYGLLDQALALQWVRRNIEAFGGNSSMVTIFGESAGGSSVDMHVVSKGSHGLFDQAITESGQAVAFWNIREEFEMKKRQFAFQLGKLVNCSTTDSTELVECLRLVDAMVLEQTVAMNLIHMGPTIDGHFIDDYPRAITNRGEFKHCPMMIGFNRDEGSLVTKSLTTISGFTADLLEDAVKQEYVDWADAETPGYNYFHTIVSVYGDDEFSCPAILTARAHAMMTSQPVYLYHFTHVPEWSIFEINGTGPGWLGAGHAEEIPFVFGYPFLPELDGYHGPMTDEEKELSVKLIKYWTHFAWTGHPSSIMINGNITDGMNMTMDYMDPAEGMGMEDTMETNVTMEMIHELAWLPFTVPELYFKELGLMSHIKRGLKSDECAFWDGFKLDLQSYLVSMDQTELEWREEFEDWQDDLDDWRMSYQKYTQSPYCG
ncbi:putative cholinesterase 1 [Apostichopus japonicus]|uniref:Carboxylic ester hydrolase n=1 Tax=Stichopus japonicus TaxID=307972 RepID=A0A2G8LAX1_STIJA|nr:putative cholinesterase 1 [Apostichopus japonicus]